MGSGPRVGWVDAARASAILLMVVFHFCYDLQYFGYVDWNVPNGPGWWQFRYLILTLFLGTVGISLSLSHVREICWPKFWRRILQIGLAALAITLMSLVVFSDAWIYFGILHFIVFSSLLGIGLVRFPKAALAGGATILVIHWSGVVSPVWPFGLIDQYLPNYTEDFVPLLPWLGVVFLGIWIGSLIQTRKIPCGHLQLPFWLNFVARHSLVIYLLHQPLLFAVFIGLGKYA